METLTLFVAIIIIVVAVLQIILFFKIWGMTNDIRTFKNELIPHSERIIMREVLKGNPKVEGILFDSLYNDLYIACESAFGGYDSIIDQYKLYYQKAGLKFPSKFENIKSGNDFRELISLEKEN